MESFYGGRQGAPFVIKKRFKYTDKTDPAYIVEVAAGNYVPEDEIMAEYVINPDNKDLWYNEYCIIDTANKNNINNGKIYRRTIATEADAAAGNFKCAEYVGQIVGPSSGAPFIKPQAGLLNANTIRNDLIGEWDGLGIAKDGTLVTYDPSFSQGEYSQWPDNIEIQTYSAGIGSGLIAGYTQAGGAVDDIKFNWYNVRKNTENNDGVVESWCYIGFEQPYAVFNFDAKYKTPGTQPKVWEQEDSKDHAYWWNYMLEIPNGLRGVSVISVFNNDPDEDDNIVSTPAYLFTQLKYDEEESSYRIEGNSKNYDTKSWFCKIQWTNPNIDGDTPVTQETTMYLGKITELKDVSFDAATGKLTCTYHNKNTYSLDIDYPKSIVFNNDTGAYTIDYSVGNDVKGQFVYPKTISMDTLGNVSYIDSASTNVDMGQLCFVDDVVVDSSHQLLIAYTDNAQIETTMPVVSMNGKSYYNYGQTISKLGVQSAAITGESIESILSQFETQYPSGVVNGEVSGALHVVTTAPTDGSDPVSYFVMWDPDAGKWVQIAEIKAGGGSVAQIGSGSAWTYSDKESAEGAIRLIQLDQEIADESSFVFPWI